MEIDLDTPPKLDGPLSLELLEKWSLWLEGVATRERDLGFATRLVLLNVLKHLTTTGLMDGQQFVRGLQLQTDQIQNSAERVAAEVVLADLARQLETQAPETIDASGPH